MSTPSIVIASAARTAVGSFNGAFANTPAHELGAAAISAVLSRAGVDAGEVDEVILGQVLPAGEGQNPARQAAMKAGIPQESDRLGHEPALRFRPARRRLGMQQIATGDADIIVAGGMESMSMAPHCAHLRGGVKMGDIKMIDTMIKDGLTDAFYGYHMGITAENVATQWQLSREEQDEPSPSPRRTRPRPRRGWAASRTRSCPSPSRAARATCRRSDEYIRAGATLDGMAKLRPPSTRKAR
jgi:acetyl-CoA C-acetyltransferase